MGEVSKTVVLNFDGACWPNPGGPASWGYTLVGPLGLDEAAFGVVEGEEVTNNVAEWCALWKGLVRLADSPPRLPGWELMVLGDSDLVVRQLNGVWRCKKDSLRSYLNRCLALLRGLGCEWRARWVPREENGRADRLTREAWEGHTGESFPEMPDWRRCLSRDDRPPPR